MYFPYCTGDVHSGNHIGQYEKKVYHYSGRNIDLALAYLVKSNLIEFSKASVYIDFNDGMVSKKMSPFFEAHQDWTIGFIYGLQDYVMSSIFGELTPKEQKENILSQDGLPEIAKEHTNVKFWLKDTQMHTFMLSRYSAMLKNPAGESVLKFIERLYGESMDQSQRPQ